MQMNCRRLKATVAEQPARYPLHKRLQGRAELANLDAAWTPDRQLRNRPPVNLGKEFLELLASLPAAAPGVVRPVAHLALHRQNLTITRIPVAHRVYC